jgi:hypothetical protein
MTSPSPNAAIERLMAILPVSPDAYPHKIDFVQQRLLLIALNRDAYRASSFLDDRVLAPTTVGSWLPLERAIELSQSIMSDHRVHFIFHTGHVGSTLLSRLLDEVGVLSLREPLTLRNLSDAADQLRQVESLVSEQQFERLLQMLLRYWSRGYETAQSVVVKATSSTARIAVSLLNAASRSNAVYLNLRAEPYLVALLSGQNSPADLRGHGPNRVRRLQARIPEPLPALHSLSMGELAALSWLAETWTQIDLGREFGRRVLSIDFDQMLSDIPGTLESVLNHFALPSTPEAIARLGTSRQLTRYSKSTDHQYSPAVRTQILNDSRQRNRDEIQRGMTWLENMARQEAGVAAVLDVSGRKD